MFWGEHTRSLVFFLSCLLFVLVLCSSSRPVPCRMHFALPLPTSCPLLFCLFGARTQAPTPTHAVCHHSHLSFNQSFWTLAARYLCVTPRVDTLGNAAANWPLAFQPKVSGILWCLTYSSRLGLFVFGVVLDEACLLYAFVTCYATYSFCLGLVVFCDAQEGASLNACMAAHATYSSVCGLFVFCDAQE